MEARDSDFGLSERQLRELVQGLPREGRDSNFGLSDRQMRELLARMEAQSDGRDGDEDEHDETAEEAICGREEEIASEVSLKVETTRATLAIEETVKSTATVGDKEAGDVLAEAEDNDASGQQAQPSRRRSWTVNTSYIDQRTSDVNRLSARVRSLAVDTGGHVAVPGSPRSVAEPPPSPTVKKKVGGHWKVDTSYVNYRTIDPENLKRSMKESVEDRAAEEAIRADKEAAPIDEQAEDKKEVVATPKEKPAPVPEHTTASKVSIEVVPVVVGHEAVRPESHRPYRRRVTIAPDMAQMIMVDEQTSMPDDPEELAPATPQPLHEPTRIKSDDSEMQAQATPQPLSASDIVEAEESWLQGLSGRMAQRLEHKLLASVETNMSAALAGSLAELRGSLGQLRQYGAPAAPHTWMAAEAR